MEIETKKRDQDWEKGEALFEELSIVEVEERLQFGPPCCCSEEPAHAE